MGKALRTQIGLSHLGWGSVLIVSVSSIFGLVSQDRGYMAPRIWMWEMMHTMEDLVEEAETLLACCFIYQLLAGVCTPYVNGCGLWAILYRGVWDVPPCGGRSRKAAPPPSANKLRHTIEFFWEIDPGHCEGGLG